MDGDVQSAQSVSPERLTNADGDGDDDRANIDTPTVHEMDVHSLL